MKEVINADTISFPLTHVYWTGVVVEMFICILVIAYGTFQFVKALPKLPFLMKTFAIVLLSDWFMAVNFFFRDIMNLKKGVLDADSTWCTFSGFMAIFTSMGCRMYFGIFAFAAYNGVIGKPLPDKMIALLLGASWSLSLIICIMWLREDTYGSYKGLYCAIKESAYYPYLTAPCFMVTFFSIDSLLYFSWIGYEHMSYAKVASQDAEILLKRGLIHGLSHYALWGGLITVGCITAVGGAVPAYIDLATAWILKTESIVDTMLLLGTIDAFVNKKEVKRGGHHSSVGSVGEEKTQLTSGKPGARPPPSASTAPRPGPGAGGGAPSGPAPVPVGSQSAINRPPAPAPAPAPAPSVPANPFIPPPLSG